MTSHRGSATAGPMCVRCGRTAFWHPDGSCHSFGALTAPTPSGGAASPLSAEEASAFLLRLANDLGTTHGIDDGGVHRRVFNLTPKACDRLREIATALLAARRGEASLRQSLRDDAMCVSQWFDDSWSGETNEPVYQAAQRLWAALAATPEEKTNA